MPETVKEVWSIRSIATGFGVSLQSIRVWIAGGYKERMDPPLPYIPIRGQTGNHGGDRYAFILDDVAAWAKHHGYTFKRPKEKPNGKGD